MWLPMFYCLLYRLDERGHVGWWISRGPCLLEDLRLVVPLSSIRGQAFFLFLASSVQWVLQRIQVPLDGASVPLSVSWDHTSVLVVLAVIPRMCSASGFGGVLCFGRAELCHMWRGHLGRGTFNRGAEKHGPRRPTGLLCWCGSGLVREVEALFLSIYIW